MTPSRTRLLAGLSLLLAALLAGGVRSRPADKPDDKAGVALPERNGVNATETGIVADFSVTKNKEKNVRWKAQLGDACYGSVVVAGGRVFIGTNNKKPRDPKFKGDKGVLMCFRESDGEFLWQAVHDKLPHKDQNDFADIGVTSTPVVEGERLYYVSNRCELVCADVAGDEKTHKAKVLWTLDMFKELKVFPCQASNSAPLIVGDLVFVCTSNGVDPEEFNVPAPDAPSFIAVERKTGKVKWKDNSPGKNIMMGQWTSPTAARVNGKWQVIFGGGDGWLYSFEAETGKLVWKFDCNPKKAEYKPGGRGDRNYFVATPVFHDGLLYIGVGQNPDDGVGVGHLWCIDPAREPKNKDRDLSPADEDFDPKSPKNRDSGLVWHYGGPVIPKPKPEENKRDILFGRTVSTVAVHDGLVYAPELGGFLHCLDAKTGKQYWEYDFKAGIWSSPYLVDGKLFLGTDSGDMYVFEPGKTLKEPKPIDMGPPIKTPPAASRGVLFVSNQGWLYAFAK
jgi:outer membrane protein assembly factor BamB